jgi:hypothetical protein
MLRQSGEIRSLPVLIVRENNGLSEFTEAARQLATSPSRTGGLRHGLQAR